MSLSDPDLEMLESYLDGELSGSEGDALIDRLRREPQLAGALETLKGERAVRVAIWQSCEPSEASVERLMGRVERKIDNHWMWTRRLSKLRVLSGAAACILVGVLMGYAGRGQNQPGRADQPMLVQGQPVSTAGGSGGPVDVPLVDEYGNVVAVQRFDDAAKAQQFIEDMRQDEAKREQGHTPGKIVPVSQKF